jgi:hypothetical protein
MKKLGCCQPHPQPHLNRVHAKILGFSRNYANGCNGILLDLNEVNFVRGVGQFLEAMFHLIIQMKQQLVPISPLSSAHASHVKWYKWNGYVVFVIYCDWAEISSSPGLLPGGQRSHSTSTAIWRTGPYSTPRRRLSPKRVKASCYLW